ncbi:MAG: hypothetical protein ACYTAF_09970, partial [Planctomycetota bacterium]
MKKDVLVLTAIAVLAAAIYLIQHALKPAAREELPLPTENQVVVPERVSTAWHGEDSADLEAICDSTDSFILYYLNAFPGATKERLQEALGSMKSGFPYVLMLHAESPPGSADCLVAYCVVLGATVAPSRVWLAKRTKDGYRYVKPSMEGLEQME